MRVKFLPPNVVPAVLVLVLYMLKLSEKSGF